MAAPLGTVAAVGGRALQLSPGGARLLGAGLVGGLIVGLVVAVLVRRVGGSTGGSDRPVASPGSDADAGTGEPADGGAEAAGSGEGPIDYDASPEEGPGLLATLNPFHEPSEEGLEDMLEDETLAQAEDEHRLLAEIEDLHTSVVAPPSVEWETRSARVGDRWSRTMFVADYPDYPQDGYLSELFNTTDVEFDLTVHVTPRNQEMARQELQEAAEDVQIEAELDESARSEYLQDRAQAAMSTYKAVEGGQRVFDQATFVTVWADSREQLRDDARTIRSVLRDEPANLAPKTAILKQDLALRSTSPIGDNVFGRRSTCLGGAVGALLGSLHNATILEEGGVEFGIHRDNRSPVVVDPFERQNGYSMFTVGDVGSGKSFGAKQNFVRSIEQRRDRIGVILEPLGNWAGVAEALDAQRITVGGTTGINPLEIKPTPEHVRRAMAEDASPFKEKKEDAMSFLANYFSFRGVALGDKRTTLESALNGAYEAKGITADVATHDNESPTIRDVMDVLEEMAADPESHVVRTEREAAKIREDAKWLIDQLRPFEEGGRYANLGRQTDFDFRDTKVVYLDLGQQEGSLGGTTSLIMQLLISLVYERAKETEKEVVFSIDEARYVMQDAANLSFLETVFRHHRHHDLSIRLITQTVDEFFQHAESEAILDQCVIKQFHRLDGMDEEWAEEFELNPAQMQFVQRAVPGSEETGYSEALLGVDGEWRGIEIHAMEKERQVIDFEAREQSREELPGYGRNAISDEARAVRQQLASHADSSEGATAADDAGTADPTSGSGADDGADAPRPQSSAEQADADAFIFSEEPDQDD